MPGKTGNDIAPSQYPILHAYALNHFQEIDNEECVAVRNRDGLAHYVVWGSCQLIQVLRHEKNSHKF